MDDKPVTVALPENLTIAHAEAVYANLEAFSQASQDVVLDAAAVASVDTAGLQILAAFIGDLKKGGINLSWTNPSAVLKETALILGMGELLLLN